MLEAASSRPQSRDSNSAQLRPKSSDGKAEEVVITTRLTSNIPMLTPKNGSPQKATSVALSTPVRIGLAERPGAGNIVKKPSPSLEKTANPAASTVSETGSPKKLRMQSPQKLRERLHNEQNAIAAANASLQDELSKIGEELTLTPSRMGSTAMRSSRNTSSQPSTMDLAQRVLKMESLLANQVDDLNLRIKTIQSDMSSSLTVSEAKCKKLDELYREANGENEALYTKFNDELGRILKAVRGGEGVEEMKKRLKEEQEESGRLKREVARLKRENLGLRSQIRE